MCVHLFNQKSLRETRGGPFALFIFATIEFSVLHYCDRPKSKQPCFGFSDVLLDGSCTVRFDGLDLSLRYQEGKF